jgi:hypothetical protein
MFGLGSLCPRLFFLVFSLEVTHFFSFFLEIKKRQLLAYLGTAQNLSIIVLARK